MTTSQGVLLVFAKAPVAGEVKTRLIPDVGCQRATDLYKELLTKTLSTASETEFPEVQVWVSGSIYHPYFTSYRSKNEFEFHLQKGKELGERMFNAFDEALSKYSYAVLIGSDCPSLLSSDLNSAINFLESGKDIVLGPAKDGGYYLIGLRQNNANLFSDIAWGEDSVFSETCSRVKKINLDMALLQKRSDVDIFSDLPAYFKMKKNNEMG